MFRAYPHSFRLAQNQHKQSACRIVCLSQVDGDNPCCSSTRPLDFSLQSKEMSEPPKAVNRCFLLSEELSTSCSQYHMCFSKNVSGTGDKPSAASIRISIVVHWCSWDPTGAKMYRNQFLNVQLRRMRSLVSYRMADCCFSTRRVSQVEDSSGSYATSTGIDPRLLRREDTLFHSVACSPISGKSPVAERPLPKPAQMATITMLGVCEELVFSAPVLRYWAGVQVALGQGIQRWSDLQHGKDLTLTGRCIDGRHLANEEALCSGSVGIPTSWCLRS